MVLVVLPHFVISPNFLVWNFAERHNSRRVSEKVPIPGNYMKLRYFTLDHVCKLGLVNPENYGEIYVHGNSLSQHADW